MKKRIFQLVVTMLVTCIGSLSSGQDSSSTSLGPICTPDSFPELPDVAIVSVTEESGPVAHCRVAGVIGVETHFELLLPDRWNGKFVMGGGGGFVGVVMNGALPYGALQAGYATAGTDTGHQAHPLDASWALNNLERIVSFGHKAVHLTAVTAQALTSAYYEQDLSSRYFVGCSRGGGQALMEAQRYPADFDGIVAGAPAYHWTHEAGGRSIWINQAMYPDPDSLSLAIIGPEETQLIGEAVMEQCDSLDGLQDGILNNPLECGFDVSSLECDEGKTDRCLSQQEVEAARRIYDDFHDEEGLIFPGYPPGAELGPGGWARWVTGGLELQPQEPVRSFPFPKPVTPNLMFTLSNGVMKYLVFQDPEWSYVNYSFRTFRSDAAAVAQTLNATDPDLTQFRERGGKLLMYTGWRDMALAPLGTIDYYEQVIEHDENAREDVRLIMMPGMDHCSGGPGPGSVNFLDEIDEWVQTGEAPDQLTAYWLDDQKQPNGSRPVCAYPTHLRYDGIGSPRDASSFTCVY